MKILKTEMKLPTEALEALERFHAAGYEAFVVGGAVRSHLLGLTADDYDIATNASEDAIMELFPQGKPIGKAFGVVQVNVGEKSFEVARYRKESAYADGRHPGEIAYPETIEADICRRDFTCNALYYDCVKKEIVDLTGGIADIKAKIIRCIGNPVERLIKEDCLRMLRAVRFAVTLGFEIHEDALNVIVENATHILRVSQERTRDELDKILLSENAYIGVRLLAKTNLLQAALPEVALGMSFGQHNPYHQFDLFEHTAQTLKDWGKDFFRLTEKEQLTVKLALLLHDTGKPYACMVKNGKCTYPGHPDVSERIAAAVLKRLKYSNEISEKVELLVKCHDYEIPATAKACKKLLDTLGEELFILWKVMKRQDVKAHSDFNGVRAEYFVKLEKLDEIYDQVKKTGQCFSMGALKINGGDLIRAGYAEGVRTGQKLKEIYGLVLEDVLPNDRGALLNYALDTIGAE